MKQMPNSNKSALKGEPTSVEDIVMKAIPHFSYPVISDGRTVVHLYSDLCEKEQHQQHILNILYFLLNTDQRNLEKKVHIFLFRQIFAQNSQN